MKTVENSLQKVARWVEEHDYKAYDPGDGNLSFLRHLTLNSHFLRRLLTGAVLRAPFTSDHDRHQATYVHKGNGVHGVGLCENVRLDGERRLPPPRGVLLSIG